MPRENGAYRAKPACPGLPCLKEETKRAPPPAMETQPLLPYALKNSRA